MINRKYSVENMQTLAIIYMSLTGGFSLVVLKALHHEITLLTAIFRHEKQSHREEYIFIKIIDY